jgi:hypothetical protein
MRKGRIKSWKRQIPIDLHAPGGGKVCTYITDLEMTYPNGHIEWHKVKGRWTPVAAPKVKHCRLEYRNRKLVVIAAKGWS